MRLFAPAGVGVAALAALSLASPALGTPSTPVDPVRSIETREIIVRFDPGTPVAERSEAIQSVEAASQQPIAGLPRSHELTLPEGASVGTALATLRARPDVAWAVPNGRARLMATPNDPYFTANLLWGMPDIGAASAWDVTTGSTDVTVGVVDSGLPSAHPDLGANLRADLGRNFVGTPGDSAWEDVNGHGAHVAGTIGAVGNNGIGVTGVTWRVGLIPVRSFDMFGFGDTADVVAGLGWAAQRSRVVNASFTSPYASDATAYTSVIQQYPETLFVAAAGNGGADGVGDNNDATPDYPCALTLPNLICVAALTQQGGGSPPALATYSNYGAASVDLGAPGTGVQSTYIPFVSITSTPAVTDITTWTTTPGGGFWTTVAGGASTYVMTDGTAPDSTYALTSPTLALTGGTGCRIEFDAAVTLSGATKVFIEAKETAAGSWTKVGELNALDSTGGVFGEFGTSLAGLDGSSGMQVRFRVVPSSTPKVFGAAGPYVKIASPAVRCVGTQPADGSYQSLSGTSMATPQVAGAAALLLAKQPSLTVAQLRSLLLDTGAATPSLAGKTVTGKRLDLGAAMAALSPPAAAAGAGDAPAAAPVALAPMALLLRGGRGLQLKVKKDAVQVPLECSGAAAARCAMTVTLRHQVKTPKSRRKQWKVLATKAASVPAGGSATVTLALNAYAKGVLKKTRSLAAELVTAPAGGSPGDTRTATVRITGKGR